MAQLQTDYEHFEAGAQSLMKYAGETNDAGHFLSSVEFYRLQAHPPNSITEGNRTKLKHFYPAVRHYTQELGGDLTSAIPP